MESKNTLNYEKHGLTRCAPAQSLCAAAQFVYRDILSIFIIALFQSCSIYRGAWVEYQASHFWHLFAAQISSLPRALNKLEIFSLNAIVFFMFLMFLSVLDVLDVLECS